MAVFRKEPRATEPTETRVVEMTADGRIVSSEPLEVTAEPVAHQVVPQQMVQQPPPQVIRVKKGGTGALTMLSLVLMLALAGLGFYVYQTRDDAVAAQQAELELQQQRTVAQEKLEQLGKAADDLGAQVRDTQRDLGIQATPPPAGAAPPATTPATAPVQPAAPAQQ